MRRTVVPQNLRMIDRHIGGPLLEIAHRVTAGRHDPLDQSVGIVNGGGRIVDEARLHSLPLVVEALTLVGREVPDVELRYALLAGRQLVFRAAYVAHLRHGPVVLGSELLAELVATL